MAHSYRHTPIFGITTARSEKYDKRIANRAFRKLAKQAITVGRFDRVPYHMLRVSNPWSMAKDGRIWWTPKWLDQVENFRRSMRK